jgi:transcription antitermination factor NusG
MKKGVYVLEIIKSKKRKIINLINRKITLSNLEYCIGEIKDIIGFDDYLFIEIIDENKLIIDIFRGIDGVKGFLKMENDLCMLSDYELEKFGFKSI